jgi:Ni/Fe-hydrogenase subunit HybB-like protein
MSFSLPKLTFWKVVAAFILAAGVWATWIRFAHGLGASTNLNDDFPWGLWIGFDVLCGVMLAAGGFTLTAAVHIFNLERFRPIIRPTVLTAFLGYALVVVALLFDLGQPFRIWHPLVMWNPRSVMFEVAWCVMLYNTVLALEFAPVVFERLRLERARRILRAISVPIVIAGVILSTLHQSSLGSLYLIVPNKLHPLWYSPLLPVFFFLSAIGIGLAMTIFESSMSAKHFGKQLELGILQSLGRVLVVVLAVYFVLRLQDLYHRDALQYLLESSYETNLFLLEVVLGLMLPMALLLNPRIRRSPNGLYFAAVLTVLGFVTNRLNVSITGMETAAGLRYIPKWTELAVTASIVVLGFIIFGLAAKHLPIFTNGGDSGPASAAQSAPARRPAPAMHA